MRNKARFQNLDCNIKPKGFIDVLKWKLTSRRAIWPRIIALGAADVPPAEITDDRVRISYVGHVTFLIQFKGFNILTDPVWSDRASPVAFLGPKRVVSPGIMFENLPKINLVLISHNHYDHLDINTLRKIWRRDKPQIIAPLMNDITIKNAIKSAKVCTLNWSESVDIGNNCVVILEPAQHWSARSLFDSNKALWGTFIIKTPRGSICFIGDSGYNKDLFKTIGSKYNDILISLIPIGAFEPRWFMKDMHMNPEEALLTHQDLNSQYSIGSHFNVFPLADEAFDQAVSELANARTKYNVSDGAFITPRIGGVYWF